uniref:Uncharacterized protein n=1 Tax=Anguilla anguilla TaxID=7936 RepID=A0A0E9X2U1_ANGAN
MSKPWADPVLILFVIRERCLIHIGCLLDVLEQCFTNRVLVNYCALLLVSI